MSMGALRKGTHQPDVQQAVKAMIDKARDVRDDPTNLDDIKNLIEMLESLLALEKQAYRFQRQSSDLRRRIESLQNLILCLESHAQKAGRAVARKGSKCCLARISNKVTGNEMRRIWQSIESQLQSWLDQQIVRALVEAILNDSVDVQVQAISSFQAVVKKGYDSQLQETILSAGIVEKLTSLLKPNASPWRVQKEAALALSALLDFNRDMFLSLMLMAGVVEDLLALLDPRASDKQILIFVCVLKNLLLAGHTIVVEEIYAKNGVSKLVSLFDRHNQSLQNEALDCVFQLAYHGRFEVVQKLFHLEVVKKLARLQNAGSFSSHECEKKQGMDDVFLGKLTDEGMELEGAQAHYPFAEVVIRFAIHVSYGTGLTTRERSALKQEFFRQIKEVIDDDAEIANITAEVLWTP